MQKMKGVIAIDKLTDKEKMFADEYILSGNKTQAYKKAFNPKKKSTASTQGCKLFKKPNVRAYIERQLQEISQSKIATAEEIFEYWTSVMRGEHVSTMVVIVGKGEGISAPKTVKRKPTEQESLQASKELAKRLIDVSTEESKEDKIDKMLEILEGGLIE